MATRPINFSAGPAKLPMQVLEKAQDEMFDFAKTGCSVMEISHRSPEFKHVICQAEKTIRELWDIPANYKVLFLQGGATGQFASIPLNLMTTGKADYIVTGTWSKKAAEEAEKYGNVNYVLPKTSKFTSIPEPSTWNLNPEADYCYYCVNETVQGIEFQDIPEVPANVPLIADMSSNALTKPVDVSKFGIIYACTQKNLGTAGVTVMVIREDLIGNQRKNCPIIFNFKVMSDNESLYNTPPTWSIYITKLFLDWLMKEGGMKHFETLSLQKSKLIYDIIDSSQNYFRGTVEKSARSRMNVCFRINGTDGTPSQQLEDKFFADGKKLGLISMKGHRSVGGVRICLYNAMSMEETEKLGRFMKQYMAENHEQ
jgi:phosphoserine aminotransferase